MIHFKRSIVRKAVNSASVCVLGALLAVVATGLGVTGCDRDGGGFSIRNLFGVGSLGPALLSEDSTPEDGAEAPADDAEAGQSARGADGVSCWDLNGNGEVDVESEDVNGDGRVDVLDCRGGGGQSGADGRSCWDLNGDGVGDVQNEDVNGDGVVDMLDCAGQAGADGAEGTDGLDGGNGSDGGNGLNCWDLNGNGVADPDEDANGDGVWDAWDCQGPRGTSGGSGGTGSTGATGLACWDLNGNGEADLDTEDTNDDGSVDVLDCRGDSGGGGAGQDGMDGRSCWDLNENGVKDLDTEDVNGDGVVDVLDCRGDGEGGGDVGPPGADGADGADGLDCWDLNENGVKDPDTEDVNGDGVVDVLDCRGADGADGEDGGPGGGGGPLLFDTFIDDFFTVANGSYDAIPLGGDDLPVVEIVEPAMGVCGEETGSVDVLGFRAAVSPWYGAGNPVTMRLFIWRTGPQGNNCFLFRLDAFRARHGTGVMRYGEPRYILLNDPGSPDPSGTLLAVDLPLNNGSNDLTQGLCLPDDLAGGDLLAFEFNSVQGFDDGGCFTLVGVEFFESPSDSDVAVVHAIAMETLQGVSCGGGMADCNQNFIDDAIDTGAAPPAGMVVVCHVPVTDPTNRTTLVIPMSYLNGHMAHGDSIGPCSDDCNTNGIPDECEIDVNSTAPGGTFFCGPDCVDCIVVCDPDCNDNGIPDSCEDPEGPNCG